MLKLEKSFDGICCGIDEAGRAPLAGPVTAACVYIPKEHYRKRFWSKVTDSKKLPLETREDLFPKIQKFSCFGIAHSLVEEIDEINIHHATLLAMMRAYNAMCDNFDIKPEQALIDGKFCPRDMSCETMAVIGGDGTSLSIAAASILAKVERDRLMKKLHNNFPVYGWNRNVGYPTPEHRAAINDHGVTSHHRKTFQPVRAYLLEMESKVQDG